MREGKEIEKIVQETYDKANDMEDKVKALKYLDKVFNGLKKIDYDVSYERDWYFSVVMETILDEGEIIAEEQDEYRGLKHIRDSFKRVEDAGYNISVYKLEYWEMFEDYTGMNMIEMTDPSYE